MVARYGPDRILSFARQYFDEISVASNQDRGVIGLSVCLYLTLGETTFRDRTFLLIKEFPEYANLSLLKKLSTSLWPSFQKIPREKWRDYLELIKKLEESDLDQIEAMFKQLEDKEIRLFVIDYITLSGIHGGIEICLRLISIVDDEKEWDNIVVFIQREGKSLGYRYYTEILLRLITTFGKNDVKRNIFINSAKEYFNGLPLEYYDKEIIPLFKIVFNIEDDNFWQKFLEIVKIFESFTRTYRISSHEIRNEFLEKTISFIKHYLADLEEIISENQQLGKEIIGASLYIYLKFGQNSLENFISFVKEFSSFIGFIDYSFFFSELFQLWPEVEKIPIDKRKDYISICFRLRESPSQEIQRILDSLIIEILESSNPEETYQTIISVLEKNNLPFIAKIFNIFDALHPADVLDSKVRKHKILYWVKSHLRRIYIIYLDLLRIHIESANPSLRDYIMTLISGQELLDKFEREGPEFLSDEERLRLTYFFRRLEALYVNSYLGRSRKAKVEVGDIDLSQFYHKLRENLKVQEGQTVIDRISEMFLKPLGIKSLSEVYQRMIETKRLADERNRRLYEEAKKNSDGVNVYLPIESGDIIKGTGSVYLSSHLENGIVAKEFLGAYFPGSDFTPLDTDAVRPMEPRTEKRKMSVADALKTYEVEAYGDIILVIKDRGQWEDTSKDKTPKYNPNKYELFITGEISSRHVGIRTGIASTEIDFIIATDAIINDKEKLENIYYEITRNGFYIPVVAESGKVIFTPEMYEEYSKTFEGLERFYRQPLEVKRLTDEIIVNVGKEQLTVSGKKIEELVEEELRKSRGDREKLKKLDALIRNSIKQVLEGMGTTLRDPESPEVRGADLFNTGSTGRMTNLAGDYDFDFILRVDRIHDRKLAEVAGKIKNNFDYQEDHSHSPRFDYYQIQLKGIRGMVSDGQVKPWGELLGEDAPATIDIDIGISPKHTLVVFGSYEAVIEKLGSIKNPEDREFVIGNILLAKRILKEGSAYERVAHGGFGGIGTENWILVNGGNIVEACRTFLEAAIDEKGNIIPFNEFKRRYKILNPGVNLRHMNHDNYIGNMREEGYRVMVNCLINFLKENILTN